MKTFYFKLFVLIVSALSISSMLQAQLAPASSPGGVTLSNNPGGTSNRTSLAYNPTLQLYYSSNGGTVGNPLQTFDASGNLVADSASTFDVRGLWWNTALNQLEGNGYNTFGVHHVILDANGYPTETSNLIFGDTVQPDLQSIGDYDYDANEIIYHYQGSIYRYDRTTGLSAGTYALNNIPSGGAINDWAVMYTGVPGQEILIYDYSLRKVYAFNKANGNFTGECQLPATAPQPSITRVSYANGLFWLYDSSTGWVSYDIWCQGSLTVTETITNVTCNGGSDGSVFVSIAGGTAPYQVLGGNQYTTDTFTIASSLTAGTTYSYQIVDANTFCAVVSGTITEPNPIYFNLNSVTNTSCNGGSDGAIDIEALGTAVNITTLYNEDFEAGNFNSLSERGNTATAIIDNTTPAPNNSNNYVAISGASGNWQGFYAPVGDGTTTADSIFFDVNFSSLVNRTRVLLGDTTLATSALALEFYNGGMGYFTSAGSFVNLTNGITTNTWYHVEIQNINYTTFTYDVYLDGTLLSANIPFMQNTNYTARFYMYNAFNFDGNPSLWDNIEIIGISTNNTYQWSNGNSGIPLSGLTAGNYAVTVTDVNGCTADTTITVTEPTAITFTAVETSCSNGADGEITVTASGGTGNLEYSSDNGVTFQSSNVLTGLAVGSYNIVVKDANGCTTSAQSVSVASCFTAAVSNTTNVSCNAGSDGSVEVTVTGGATPYSDGTNSYNTNPFTITGLSAGAFAYTITDGNGATSSISGTLTEPTAVVASIAIDSNATCNGFADGGLTASATGGTGSYTYSWSNTATTASITGVMAGNYTVTVTDANSCTNNVTETVTEPTAVILSLDNTIDVSCPGGNDGVLDVSASGGSSGTNTVVILYAEDFDGFPVDNASFAPGAEPNPLPNNWNNVQADTAVQDWYGRSNATGSSNTGPSADHTSGTGTYVFVEDGYGNHTDISLESPSIDLSSVADAQVNYWVHSRTTSSSTNTMYVDVFANGVWNLGVDVVGALSTTDTWFERNIDVSSYVGGSIIVRFRVDNSTTSFQHDIAIDDFSVTSTSATSVIYNYMWSGANNYTATGDSITGLAAGSYTVTATDGAGCTDVQTYSVGTVPDVTMPTVVTQDITVQLDASGNATITEAQIDNGSTDNCTAAGSLTYALDITTFSCADIGTNTVTLTVTDGSNNSATGTATVTVQDMIAPTVITQNATVQLDATTGSATITTMDIDNGSTDNCTAAGNLTMTLSNNTFSCADIGTNNVMLYVTDANGNIDSAMATVTVQNYIQNFVLGDSTFCSGTTSLDLSILEPSAYTGGVWTNTLNVTVSTVFPANNSPYTYTYTDANGCSATATTLLSVSSITAVTTQNAVVYLDENGQVSIDASMINTTVANDCNADFTYSVDASTFGCENLGNNTVTLTGTDSNGNTTSATANINVQDTIAPMLMTQDITINLDANGDASITADDLIASMSDNCSIVSTSADKTDFVIADFGDNTVTVTVTDADGNTTSMTAIVTVNFAVNTTGIQTEDIQITAYPNPARDFIRLQMTNINEPSVLATLLDINGKVISTHQLETQDARMDVSNLPQGNYFIRIQSENAVKTVKFVKQ